MRCGVNCSLRTTSNVCTGRPATVPPDSCGRFMANLIEDTSATEKVAGYLASTPALALWPAPATTGESVSSARLG